MLYKVVGILHDRSICINNKTGEPADALTYPPWKKIWKVDVRGNKCGCMLVKERIYGALVEVNIAERVEYHTEDILLIECAFFPPAPNPEHIDNKKVHNLAFCACIYSVCFLYSVCFHFTHWKVLK